jgi:hypothetical protein
MADDAAHQATTERQTNLLLETTFSALAVLVALVGFGLTGSVFMKTGEPLLDVMTRGAGLISITMLVGGFLAGMARRMSWEDVFRLIDIFKIQDTIGRMRQIARNPDGDRSKPE